MRHQTLHDLSLARLLNFGERVAECIERERERERMETVSLAFPTTALLTCFGGWPRLQQVGVAVAVTSGSVATGLCALSMSRRRRQAKAAAWPLLLNGTWLPGWPAGRPAELLAAGVHHGGGGGFHCLAALDRLTSGAHAPRQDLPLWPMNSRLAGRRRLNGSPDSRLTGTAATVLLACG